MKIARTLGLFAIAVLFTSVPMVAGCYSDCDEAYESCTAAANYAVGQCEGQCYYDSVNCPSQCEAGYMQCLDTTYPYPPYPPTCAFYLTDLNWGYDRYAEWPFVCQLCYIDYMTLCPYNCVNTYQSCMYDCDDTWYGTLSQCDYSNYQCKSACCGDSTCEGDESCGTCASDCGPC